MELVNIAYEDAEKTGSSMSFEKPLSAVSPGGLLMLWPWSFFFSPSFLTR